MTATMTTYRRTLCWTKGNTTLNTGAVFAVRAKEHGRTLCWTKGNATLNTGGVFAVRSKEHDPEHRRGACCRGKLTDHRRYRRQGVER